MPYVINPQFIPGTNGDAVISTDTALSPVQATCTGTSGTNSLSATGSFVAGQMIFIHEDTGSNYGLNETNWVVSYTAGTITTLYPLLNTYANAQVTTFVDYKSLKVTSGKITFPNWNGSKGGIFALAVKGLLDVYSGANLYLSGQQAAAGTPAGTNANGGGFRGGAGTNGGQAIQGESHSSSGGGSQTANAESGGGGHGGGGDGAHGTAIPSWDDTLQTKFPFPGAGGGSNSNSGHGRSGANGAMIGIIVAGVFRLRGTSGILGRGGDGIENQDAGPGAGANIRIITPDMRLDTTDCINVTGGVRSPGASDGDHGGAGANKQDGGSSSGPGADGHVRIETCRLAGTITSSNQSIVAGGLPYCGKVGRIG